MYGITMGYWLAGTAGAAALFAALVWGPSVPLLFELSRTGAGAGEIGEAAWTLFRLALFDESPLNTTFYALLAALSGANAALLLLYWRTRRLVEGGSAAATGALGALAAALGFGCAACGTLFLSIALGSIGGFTLAAIPFLDEIAFALRAAGIALLSFSLARLAKHVRDPLVCPVV